MKKTAAAKEKATDFVRTIEGDLPRLLTDTFAQYVRTKKLDCGPTISRQREIPEKRSTKCHTAWCKTMPLQWRVVTLGRRSAQLHDVHAIRK